MQENMYLKVSHIFVGALRAYYIPIHQLKSKSHLKNADCHSWKATRFSQINKNDKMKSLFVPVLNQLLNPSM